MCHPRFVLTHPRPAGEAAQCAVSPQPQDLWWCLLAGLPHWRQAVILTLPWGSEALDFAAHVERRREGL